MKNHRLIISAGGRSWGRTAKFKNAAKLLEELQKFPEVTAAQLRAIDGKKSPEPPGGERSPGEEEASRISVKVEKPPQLYKNTNPAPASKFMNFEIGCWNEKR